MLSVGFKWEVEPAQSIPQMFDNYTKTVFLSGRRQAEDRARDMVEWAKTNAPWEDRTGDARAGINAIVKDSPGIIAEIVLQHDPSLPYTLWLELADGGRLAIIAKTIDYFGPIFMNDMQKLVNLKLVST